MGLRLFKRVRPSPGLLSDGAQSSEARWRDSGAVGGCPSRRVPSRLAGGGGLPSFVLSEF
jgi:hypothetical protein